MKKFLISVVTFKWNAMAVLGIFMAALIAKTACTQHQAEMELRSESGYTSTVDDSKFKYYNSLSSKEQRKLLLSGDKRHPFNAAHSE